MGAETQRFTYTFKVLGHYDSRLEGNEPHVTLNVAAGRDEDVVFCGTLTMSEAEWAALRSHLESRPSDDVDIAIDTR